MKYNIIQSDDVTELIQLVNNAIKEGWTPIGGMSCRYVGGNVTYYYQSMIFVEDDQPYDWR